jgi:hypothetical protein
MEPIQEIMWKYGKWRHEWLNMTYDITKNLDEYIKPMISTGKPYRINSIEIADRTPFKSMFDRIMQHYYVYNTNLNMDRDIPPVPTKGRILFFDEVDELEKLKTSVIGYQTHLIYPFVLIRPDDLTKPVMFKLIDTQKNLDKDADFNYCRKLQEYYRMSKYKEHMEFVNINKLTDNRATNRCMLLINDKLKWYERMLYWFK